MQDLPYLNIGIWDIKAKWRRNSGRTWDPGLPKKTIGIAELSEN